MKKLIHTLLGLTAVISFGFTAQKAAGQETTTPKIPSWAQKEINKVAEAAPTITDDQKVKIFKAIEVRGKAIKKASGGGAAEADLKAQTKQAWSTYINTMKEILSAEQFTQFDKKRMEKGKKTSDE